MQTHISQQFENCNVYQEQILQMQVDLSKAQRYIEDLKAQIGHLVIKLKQQDQHAHVSGRPQQNSAHKWIAQLKRLENHHSAPVLTNDMDVLHTWSQAPVISAERVSSSENPYIISTTDDRIDGSPSPVSTPTSTRWSKYPSVVGSHIATETTSSGHGIKALPTPPQVDLKARKPSKLTNHLRKSLEREENSMVPPEEPAATGAITQPVNKVASNDSAPDEKVEILPNGRLKAIT